LPNPKPGFSKKAPFGIPKYVVLKCKVNDADNAHADHKKMVS